MAKYVQKQKWSGYHVDGSIVANEDAVTQAKQREQSKDSPSTHSDDLLDEIDNLLADTLEANETAQSFVANFRQQGGQ